MLLALRRALLLIVLAAAPAAAGGYDYAGTWEAKGITLRLTETRATVKGELDVEGAGSLSLYGRIEPGRISGSLRREGHTVEFEGTRRGVQLQLKVVFSPGKDGTRYYLLTRVDVTSVYTAGSEADDLLLVMERSGGAWRGRLRVKDTEYRLTDVRPRSGGLEGNLRGPKGSVQRFTFVRSPKGGSMVLSWPNNGFVVKRLDPLKSSFRGKSASFLHPSKAYRCRVPASWGPSRALDQQTIGFNVPLQGEPQPGKPIVLILHEPTSPAARLKRPMQRLRTEKDEVAPALVEWIQLEGRPKLEELALDGRTAAIGVWSGRASGGLLGRVWVGQVDVRATTVYVVLICLESDLARFEPEATFALGSLRAP